MRNKHSIVKKAYFKIGENEVIYPSKTFIRFLARLIDYFLAILPGALTISIYLLNTAPNTSGDYIVSLYNQLGSPSYSEFLSYYKLPLYDFMVIFGNCLIIAGLILFFMIIPLLNKKNFGQSIGKRLFKITPIYLDKRKNWKSFLIRESFIISPFIILIVLDIVVGFEVIQQISIYNQITTSNTGEMPTDVANFINNLPKSSSEIEFLLSIYDNPTYFNGVFGNAVMGIVELTFELIILLYIIIILITIAISPQKMGRHDTIANTSVVNLKSITTEEKALEAFNNDVYLDEVQKEGDNPNYGPQFEDPSNKQNEDLDPKPNSDLEETKNLKPKDDEDDSK